MRSDVNHKWGAGTDGEEACLRCSLKRRKTGKNSYRFFVGGTWQRINAPECDVRPKSQRGLPAA